VAKVWLVNRNPPFRNSPLGTFRRFVRSAAGVASRGQMVSFEEYRDAAAECLRLVRVTTDANAKAKLLMMAQKFIDRASAGSSAGEIILRKLIDEFNNAQMLKDPRRS
jgi:hypothetical protein